MEHFDIRYLKNEYGLSCIEDYTLYLLAKKNDYWQQVFFESNLAFNKVMELIDQGQTYSYFTGVPRLQKTGENLGLLNLSFYKNDSFPCELAKNKIFAMQVSEAFMKERFNKTLWRNDHYILFQYIGDDVFEYMNDIPPSVGSITTKEMEEIYANKIITIEICESFQSDYKDLIQQLTKKMMLKENESKYKKEKITFEKLRDAIGISKVLVKRMEAFVHMLGVAFSASDYYDFLSDYYIKSEYMRAKGICNVEIPNIIKQVEEKDECFQQDLMEALQKI